MNPDFSKIAPFLSHPLVLVGFVLFMLFGLFNALVKAKLIPTVTKEAGAGILHVILNYGFLIALITLLLGFMLQGIKTYYTHVENDGKAIQATYHDRANAAFSLILKEAASNLTSIGVTISSIDEDEMFAPFGKYEKRRVNETEMAYIERARNHYRDYYLSIKSAFDKSSFSESTWAAHKSELLTLGTEYSEKFENLIRHIGWARDFIQRYLDDVQHVISLELPDAESYARIVAAKTEKMASARIEICNAISVAEALVGNNDELYQFQLAIESAGIKGLQLTQGEVGIKQVMKKSLEYHNIKIETLKASTGSKIPTSELAITRKINDPYLRLLRRTMGMSEELTDADIYHLSNKTIDPEEHDFSRLLVLASTSFIEGDGEDAIVYLKRAKALNDLPENIKVYLDASIHRLENPDEFGESLGFMVMDIDIEGNFAQSGIQLSDILIGIDDKPLIEPTDISSALARTSDHPFLLKLVRNGRRIEIAIKPGKSAGATITQLVAFGQVRL